MATRALSFIQGSWQLLRFMAVASSSFATILSTMLPLSLYYSISADFLIPLFMLLIGGALLFHGVLTHILNDVSDYKSGTDEHSPAILSGGSRVTQDGYFSVDDLNKLGNRLIYAIIISCIIFTFLGSYTISILLLIGLWAAVSYSRLPLLLSYRPFAGEVFSLFPSMLALGLAGALLALDGIPVWAWQNAAVNALFCVSWVMVHHIPDRNADQQASPKKRTTVVWAMEKFGQTYSRLPALFYLFLTGTGVFWLGTERLWAALGLLVIVTASIIIVKKMNVNDEQQVATSEKIMLLLAIVNAIWLGIFI
ncbi:prenyltransferase [Salicibibacter halophilus]|uniref:Prenyltransferase n=1 Tax=Salicibibacter halophilus TaxID=2502791 RepID=A0A514LJ75_9BACI|nr:prenyltransferase [Salicibibacter halophilus]QDI91351.1 prenyltransferase [Salicibibacter halophilus]